MQRINNVLRITDFPDMTLAADHGQKAVKRFKQYLFVSFDMICF